jgi:hypothetical protein
MTMDRSSAQPQVNLSFLRRNSLKSQPQIPPCHGQRRKREKQIVFTPPPPSTPSPIAEKHTKTIVGKGQWELDANAKNLTIESI